MRCDTPMEEDPPTERAGLLPQEMGVLQLDKEHVKTLE